MKRFFILASAAIVALASCAKTEVVYKDAPEQIAFKTLNSPMTKATYGEDLGVAAYFINTENEYFGQTKFEFENGVWTGGQYWPLSNALKFIAYGPYQSSGVTISATQIFADNVESDLDFVYSYVDNDGAGYKKKDFEGAGVAMPMKHAKAKVVITVTTGDNEKVTKVELLNTPMTGDCTVAIPSEAVTWTYADADKKNVDFTSKDNIRHLVVPCPPTTIRVTYNSLNPAQTGLTTEIDLSTAIMKDKENNIVTGDWLPGYSYTYNISINSSQIVIHAQTTEWVDIVNN